MPPPIIIHVPGRPSLSLPCYHAALADYYPWCEMQVKDWLVRHVGREWVALDCGAHIGYHALLIAQLADAGRVFAFEPTTTRKMLRANIAHLRAANVEIVPMAVGRETGWRKEPLYQIWGTKPNLAAVRFTTIDAFVAERRCSRLDLLKIDVDGYDFDVLRGAEHTLARFDPWVIVEINRNLALRGTTPAMVFTWMHGQGYAEARALDGENFLFKRNIPARADWIPLPVLIWASDRQIAPDLARLAPATNPQALWAQSSFAGLAAKAAVALGTKLADTANDFTLPAWQKWQVLAFGRAFAPDLIIGLGPQANAFIAAIAPGNPKIRPKVRSHVFFNDVSVVGRPATAGPGPMTVTALRALLKNKRRILVLWTDPAPAAGDDVLGGGTPSHRHTQSCRCRNRHFGRTLFAHDTLRRQGPRHAGLGKPVVVAARSTQASRFSGTKPPHRLFRRPFDALCIRVRPDLRRAR